VENVDKVFIQRNSFEKKAYLKINICGMTLESMGKKKDQMWRKTHSSKNK
jgi:hypothetical protein